MYLQIGSVAGPRHIQSGAWRPGSTDPSQVLFAAAGGTVTSLALTRRRLGRLTGCWTARPQTTRPGSRSPSGGQWLGPKLRGRLRPCWCHPLQQRLFFRNDSQNVRTLPGELVSFLRKEATDQLTPDAPLSAPGVSRSWPVLARVRDRFRRRVAVSVSRENNPSANPIPPQLESRPRNSLNFR